MAQIFLNALVVGCGVLAFVVSVMLVAVVIARLCFKPDEFLPPVVRRRSKRGQP